MVDAAKTIASRSRSRVRGLQQNGVLGLKSRNSPAARPSRARRYEIEVTFLTCDTSKVLRLLWDFDPPDRDPDRTLPPLVSHARFRVRVACIMGLHAGLACCARTYLLWPMQRAGVHLRSETWPHILSTHNIRSQQECENDVRQPRTRGTAQSQRTVIQRWADAQRPAQHRPTAPPDAVFFAFLPSLSYWTQDVIYSTPLLSTGTLAGHVYSYTTTRPRHPCCAGALSGRRRRAQTTRTWSTASQSRKRAAELQARGRVRHSSVACCRGRRHPSPVA